MLQKAWTSAVLLSLRQHVEYDTPARHYAHGKIALVYADYIKNMSRVLPKWTAGILVVAATDGPYATNT